jgi:hypothetical protein
MNAQFDHASHSPQSLTTQLLYGLLFGNVIAILVVVAFAAGAGLAGTSSQEDAVLAVGILNLVGVALPFLASAMRRGAKPWWIVTMGLNATQIVRLVPALVVIGAWEADSVVGAMWTLLFVPFLGVLAGIGVVLTAREAGKSRRRRRRRLATAA